MKNLQRLLLFAATTLLVCSTAVAQEQKFAELGEFKLVSGEVIRDCRIGYRTFGKLNADKSNVIVFPTWAGGTTEELSGDVGPMGMVDDADYFVILLDAFANGVSSSPSNSAKQPHMKFPKITVRDMVNSQHEVLTKVLGISHVKAVMGVSMGGMQTFQWMVSYPDFMDKAIPIVGSPHVAPYDVVLWRINIDAIETNPAWNHGDYSENPSKLVESEIGELLLNSPAQYNRTHTRAQALESLAKAAEAPGKDANNKVRQSEAMMELDVADQFDGSMEKAAAAVKAEVFVIVAKQDHVVTPQPAIDFAHQVGATLLELESDCGHLAPSCEQGQVFAAVAAFLKQ
jgi:homoserine O-acetyltransferase